MDNEQIARDLRELKIESRIQTIAVVLVFIFGISTIADIYTKIKKQ